MNFIFAIIHLVFLIIFLVAIYKIYDTNMVVKELKEKLDSIQSEINALSEKTNKTLGLILNNLINMETREEPPSRDESS